MVTNWILVLSYFRHHRLQETVIAHDPERAVLDDLKTRLEAILVKTYFRQNIDGSWNPPSPLNKAYAFFHLKVLPLNDEEAQAKFKAILASLEP